MRSSPSIVPTDRLDRDIYLVLETSARAPVAPGVRRYEADTEPRGRPAKYPVRPLYSLPSFSALCASLIHSPAKRSHASLSSGLIARSASGGTHPPERGTGQCPALTSR